MKQAVGILLVVFGASALLLVVSLAVSRGARELRRSRRGEQQEYLRHLILAALLGAGVEQESANAELTARRGADWTAVEDQAFAIIPKIKGETHVALVELLAGRGAAGRAAADTHSRFQVRRARAAYHVGSLGRPESAPVLVPLLVDRHFLVRRSAVRALGELGNPDSVTPLLDAATADPMLVRDVNGALDRLGIEAAPALRVSLRRAMYGAAGGSRTATLSARALGLVGDVTATSLLVRALDSDREPALRVAAAEALGMTGARDAVRPLMHALGAEQPEVRIAASRALGAISDPGAVDGLTAALVGNTHEGAREAARALLHLGLPGRRSLEDSDSPYAAEALAVSRVRQPI